MSGALIGIPLLPWLSFVATIAWLPYPTGTETPNRASTIIQDRNGVELAAFASDDGQWRLPLTRQDVSPWLLQAIIAAEDARFYQHHGVDWKSVVGAAWQDLIHFRIVRGASTLSMQVQRLRSPKPRTLFNKIEQAIRAEQLERRLSKSDILLEYVNTAPFGGNLEGAGAASWRYFGRPCNQLSLGEAALLAGLPQSPTRLRPDRFPDRARIRRDHVLGRMLARGFVTQRQRDEASVEPINARWRALPQDRVRSDSSPTDGVLPTLVRLAHEHPGQIVRSTLDAVIQRQTALAAREQVESLEGSGVAAAAVIVLDTQTAECLAAISSGGEGNAVDLTRRPRSTGSTLKPFIYAAAFDAGVCGPRSILSDSPSAWPGYEPNDYDHSFRGPLTAAEALAESRNIPAMLVLAKLGVESALGIMDAAGLHDLAREPDRYGLTLAIGGAEASPMEIAQAYAALGRGGVSMAVRLTSPPAAALSARFLRPNSCWQVLDALAGVERTIGICPEAARSHVAWKTGTSSGHRDAWCAAVTRRRTVVVWLGNAGGEASPALVGQEAAAPLALRLIAMLDPSDEPWPLAVIQPIVPPTRPLVGSFDIVLRSPAPGQQFVLSADLPPDRQRIPLQAAHRGTHPAHPDQLWWFVDDQPVAMGPQSQRFWWNPTPGSHEIRVVDEHSRSAVAQISVR